MNRIMRKYHLLSFLLIIPVWTSLNSQDTVKMRSEYLPDIDGIIKTKVEFDLDNSKMRFDVRNARFGVTGKINDFMSYRAQIDINDEGKSKMLDAYIKVTPFPNLDIFLGQRKLPFSSDYLRNPIENIFANRSFLTKYINDGMRDIGLFADYKLPSDIPLEIFLGAGNGTGGNNPQWISRPNLIGRLIAGPFKGLRIAGNILFGEKEFREDMSMTGVEARYSTGAFFIESEYIRRSWTDTLTLRQQDDGIYIHSYYNFTVDNKVFRLITPTARWDFIGKSVLGNEVDANRITLGVNFGFEAKQFYSELRLNYENYFKSSLPVHTDKFTIELVGRF
ncbi:MAG: hypothetical protein A2V64_09275 [Bacteroidetes bacterium RBG_13_43_22]|nr:MAG: hypothetical protein A2V64_09275 [Bacteroidetes bacterium RBG_13_43_22]